MEREKKKHEYALELSELEEDSRVKGILITRYSGDVPYIVK